MGTKDFSRLKCIKKKVMMNKNNSPYTGYLAGLRRQLERLLVDQNEITII